MTARIFPQHWILLCIATLLVLAGPQVSIHLGYTFVVVVMQLTAICIVVLTAADVVIRALRAERAAIGKMFSDALESYDTVLRRYVKVLEEHESHIHRD